MYAEHVPIIAHAMRADAATFKRACMFALVSARTQFVRVPKAMRDLDRDGDKSAHLWGWKNVTLLPYYETREALKAVCLCPGMGIVKGAFVLQMLGHDIACLDTVNIAREGRNPRAYDSRGGLRKTKPEFFSKIDRYIADTHGKAQYYWDTWCDQQGEKYGMTGERISLMHVDAVVSKTLQRKAGAAIAAQDIPF